MAGALGRGEVVRGRDQRSGWDLESFGGTEMMGQDNGSCVWWEEVRVKGIKHGSQVFA